MTTPAHLPPALTPWAPALSLLDLDLAVAIGPMVRHLDQLTSRGDQHSGAVGPMDGYDGLTRRGIPARMLMSEWAIADEVPLEFLRRAAMSELLYLAPAYKEDRRRGRVAVLVDCGPDQLGAGRLLQLAALIVFHRRAAARGGELMLGVLGDEPGRWRKADLATVLRGWLLSRRGALPAAADVPTWSADLDAADEMWLLSGPRLAAELPARRRTLVSREVAWNEHGATAIEVVLDGDRAELALPRGNVAIRALRGASFRTPAPALARTDDTPLRFARFAGPDPRLLLRGRDAAELVMIPIPAEGREPGRVRRHSFTGPVLAASVVGRRLVAVVADGDVIRVHVVGKALGRLDRVQVPIFDVELDQGSIDAAVETGLGAVFFASGDLLADLGGRWWRLPPDGDPRPDNVVAIAPGALPDQPRTARPTPQRMHIDGAPGATNVPSDAQIVFGAGQLAAWSVDGSRWQILHHADAITIEDGATVIGIVLDVQRPTLVTLSPAGLVVRMVWFGGQVTLTRWSGSIERPQVHPTRPWIVVQRDNHRIEVGNLYSGALLLSVQADTA